MSDVFITSFFFKVVYVLEISDEPHSGLLKIGDTTIQTDKTFSELSPNCPELEQAAWKRIKQYTNTAGLSANLLHTELAVRITRDAQGNETVRAFRDHDVHKVLENSQIKKEQVGKTTGREWFRINKQTALRAINAVKNGSPNLGGYKEVPASRIILRPEQRAAIEQTKKQFEKGNRMLWNAKMRFGKTISALKLIQELGFKKSIIITHRPVVDAGWFEDFSRIFTDEDGYIYGSRNNGSTVQYLQGTGKKFIYFSSLQDLRGSSSVGGRFDKNDEVFSNDWDLVIIDEAHEGTTTDLGDEVIKRVIKEEPSKTKLLALSGTPFNIIKNYDDNVYTWDYLMEQRQKNEWCEINFGDSNPYDELPELRIYTYNLGNLVTNNKFVEFEDKAFNFREFFRTWTGEEELDYKATSSKRQIGDFCHEDDVISFLNLITKDDQTSHFPYANDEYRRLFRHSLWMIPGVREARALSKLLKEHPKFGCGRFRIINVAGDGDEEEKPEEALRKVRRAIDNAGDDYTITLSCGRLTTGVTVPEWNAVLMLAGSHSTSATNYLQTIFRVQSPCSTNGKIKQYCYVFDFAPDRTLKMIAESVAISTRAGRTNESDKQVMGEFLNYCPVIAVDGTEMIKYDTGKLLQHLKRAYAERAVQNGFDDVNIYNDELLKLNSVDIDKLNRLRGIIGASKSAPKSISIDINHQGFTDEEYRKIEGIREKTRKEDSAEEKELRRIIHEQKKQKANAISILRGISIRIPLLLYGASARNDDEITMEKLIEVIDDSSWEEFMPAGVTKELFMELIKFYDQDVFIVASRKIRDTIICADNYLPTERVKKISALFSCFRNPDKETVLTPWRVVNMHMSDCLGGYSFLDTDYRETIDQPRFIDQGDVTKKVLCNSSTRVLDINSKTGLYPLYVAYSIFRHRCNQLPSTSLDPKKQNELWLETVKNNIFAICKTPMARSITQRTLVGLKEYSTNTSYVKDLVEVIKRDPKKFFRKVHSSKYWKKGGSNKLNFDAIVGNPPYQENISDSEENSSLSKQIFPAFVQSAVLSGSQYISLITPSRWFTAEAQDKSFIKLRKFIMNNNHIVKVYNYPDNKMLFKNVEIAGGVNYFLFDRSYVGKVEFTECYSEATITEQRPLFEDGLEIIISMKKVVSILNRVRLNKSFVSLTTITKGRNAFGIVGKKTEVDKHTATTSFPGAVEVRCAYEETRYIDRGKISKNPTLIDKWKVYTSKGNGGAGILTDDKPITIIGRAFIGAPNTACTDSLIPIGSFDTKEEAVNLQKYMETKFLRFMVGILKVSQNVYQNVYAFVPLQDFTSQSDVNWDASMEEIDKQLYGKYGLAEDEVSYIEGKIKPIV